MRALLLFSAVATFFFSSILVTSAHKEQENLATPMANSTLLECIQQANFTQLYSVLANFSKADGGQEILLRMADGNWTVFCPDDAASTWF